MEFKPQKVDPRSVWDWFKEALALSVRKPIIFIIITLVFTSICYLPGVLGGVTFIALPLLLGLGCVVAECADNGRNPITIVMGKPRHVWTNLLLVGLVPWLAIAFLAILLMLFGPADDPLIVEQREASEVLGGGSTLLAVSFLWFLAAGYIAWFIIPLIAAAEALLAVAFEQADEALGLNRFVIMVVMAVAFSCLIGCFNAIAVFPWVAITSCMMYVSYRHIWLDRSTNVPSLNTAHGSAAVGTSL